MSLNINTNADSRSDPRTRDDLVEDLIDEMTPWNARERMSAFRSFLSGSLSLIHVHVLTILEVEGPLSMSRLAEELDVSVASATGIVGRMEQRRFVERRHEATDRRVVSVRPTRLGGEVFARLGRHRRDKLSTLLARLSDDELAALLTGLRAMRRARAAIGAEGGTEPTTDAVPPAEPAARELSGADAGAEPAS